MASGTILTNGPRNLFWKSTSGSGGQRNLIINAYDISIQFMMIMLVNRRENSAPRVVALQLYSGTCGLVPLSGNASGVSASISGNTVSVIVPEDYLTAYVLSSTPIDLAFTSA